MNLTTPEISSANNVPINASRSHQARFAALSPAFQKKKDGQTRQVGVEIEFSGISMSAIETVIDELFGGEPTRESDYRTQIKHSQLGTFTVELDAQQLHQLSDYFEQSSFDLKDFKSGLLKSVKRAAEWIVPWEVVCPPIPITELHHINDLISSLREAGAEGTKQKPQFAFGLHINPEVYQLDSDYIVRIIKAYCCLYDWLHAKERVDLSRSLSQFIQHFPKDYLELVTQTTYWPDIASLIDDYLTHNPERNRSLDCLPLFAHIDEERVAAVVSDERINARPTFHYRLPNCDINNRDWNFHQPWQRWCVIEQLAKDDGALEDFCESYQKQLKRWSYPFDSSWVTLTEEKISQHSLTQKVGDKHE